MLSRTANIRWVLIKWMNKNCKVTLEKIENSFLKKYVPTYFELLVIPSYSLVLWKQTSLYACSSLCPVHPPTHYHRWLCPPGPRARGSWCGWRRADQRRGAIKEFGPSGPHHYYDCFPDKETKTQKTISRSSNHTAVLGPRSEPRDLGSGYMI